MTDHVRLDTTDFRNNIGDMSYVPITPFTYRRTTIIVTIDNPNISVVDLYKMMEGGANIIRVTAYTMAGRETEVIGKIDKAAKFLANKYGFKSWPCATCIELKSCIVKTGILEETDEKKYIIIEENTEVILTYDILDYYKCNEHKIYVDNPYLTTDVKVGSEISIAEDTITLEVIEVNENSVKCVVIKQGPLRNLDNVYMRGAARTRPYITKEDLDVVKIAAENQVDMILMNYVRHPDTLKKMKKFMGKSSRRPWITSGICTYEGLCNVDEIIKESDAILFSREKLAYELEKKYFPRMVRLQMNVLGKCLAAGKPMFLGGQIFQSLLVSGFLANRDVTDVSHAILSGVSGFNLRTCEDTDFLKLIMHRLTEICAELEPLVGAKQTFSQSMEGVNVPLNAAITAALCCVLLANKTAAHAIIVPTVSGRTIYYLNQYQPRCHVITVTTNLTTFRQLKMYRSAVPLLYDGSPRQTWTATVNARLEHAITFCLDKNWLNYGDNYITLEKGFEESSFCDSIRAHVVVTKKKTGLCREPLDPNVAYDF